MNHSATETPQAPNFGAVLHAASAYDALVWLATFGREQTFRETILRVAKLREGEVIMDAGCGTGSLAIAARRQVGSTGTVHGVDASQEMIARARRKAVAAKLDVVFSEGTAQALPFPEASFDVVLSTLTLHHLPHRIKLEFVQETHRVLKPGGRFLLVDFAADGSVHKGLLSRLHRHGNVKLNEVATILNTVGLRCTDSAPLGFRGGFGLSRLHYMLTIKEGA